MTADECRIDTLISLPPGMADQLADCEPRTAQRCFAAADPVGCQLGSGGGTAHLLSEAWQATGDGLGFGEWLNDSRKLMIHGGGRSRRLPAYAATGKLFVPVPAYRWSLGHRIDQTLLDLQEPFLGRVCAQASPASRLLIASGDVLLRSDEPLPPLPDADVVLLGLWTTPEEAQDFGVLFSRHNDPSHLVTFLQKPTPDRIREMAGDYIFMVDVGVWLLSEKAVRLLMTRSGWDCEAQAFRDGAAEFYDLYGEWGLHLGESPCEPDEEISALTTAVVPVPGGGFYHFGRAGTSSSRSTGCRTWLSTRRSSGRWAVNHTRSSSARTRSLGRPCGRRRIIRYGSRTVTFPQPGRLRASTFLRVFRTTIGRCGWSAASAWTSCRWAIRIMPCACTA